MNKDYSRTPENIAKQVIFEMLQHFGDDTKLTYGDLIDQILDQNIVEGYFENPNAANAFIAGNLNDAIATMEDCEMRARYSARLNPLEDACSLADAMIEKAVLTIIERDMAVMDAMDDTEADKEMFLKRIVDISPVYGDSSIPDDPAFSKLTGKVEKCMRNYLARTGDISALELDLHSFGLDFAHASARDAAMYMLDHSESFSEAFEQMYMDDKNPLEDPIHTEATVLSETAFAVIRDELSAIGIDARDKLFVSCYFSEKSRLPSIDEKTAEAEDIAADRNLPNSPIEIKKSEIVLMEKM